MNVFLVLYDIFPANAVGGTHVRKDEANVPQHHNLLNIRILLFVAVFVVQVPSLRDWELSASWKGFISTRTS